VPAAPANPVNPAVPAVPAEPADPAEPAAPKAPGYGISGDVPDKPVKLIDCLSPTKIGNQDDLPTLYVLMATFCALRNQVLLHTSGFVTYLRDFS
jgi:hypothetical protein